MNIIEEWISHSDNIKYSAREGRLIKRVQGIKNGRSILTENDVLDIRKLHSKGMNISYISKLYNRGWQTINHIIKRTTWSHI